MERLLDQYEIIIKGRQDLWPNLGSFSFPTLTHDCPRTHSPLFVDSEVGFLLGDASYVQVKQIISWVLNDEAAEESLVDKTVPRTFSSILGYLTL